MLTTIPFSGFYNSVHDSNCDEVLRSTFDNDRGDVREDIFYLAQDKVDWRAVYNNYAAAYAGNFADEFHIKMEFESMKSPREYNFSTDIIYCTIEPGEVQRVFAAVDKSILDEVARETFTSRSGFISFYNPDFSTWGAVTVWDHNQVGALISAYALQQNPDFDQWGENDLMENAKCNGYIDNWLFASNPVPLNRLANINDYLNARAAR